MKQVLQNLKTGEIEVADIPVPSVKQGHLLIRTSKSLISVGTEKMLLEFGKAGWINKVRQQPDKVRQVMQKVQTDGLKPTVDAVFNKLNQPLPLGYSNVGVVLEVGEGIKGFQVGDRVLSNGHHAEVVCVPENLCAKIPSGVDDTTASFTVLSAIALQGIRLLDPTIGESVAVMGLGVIGLLTCQILRANGCRVMGTDFDKTKLDIAKKLGVEVCDLGAGADPVSAAHAFSGGHGIDAVIIAASTRSNDPIRQAPAMCRKRGRVILVGVVGLELSRDDFFKKEISFQVSCSYGPGRYDADYEQKGIDYPIGYVRWTEKRNFEAVLQLMAEDKIVTDELVSGVYPIEKAGAAYEAISDSGSIMGLVFEYATTVSVGQRQVAFNLSPARAASPQTPVVGLIGAGGFTSATIAPALKNTPAKLKTIVSSAGVTGYTVGKKFGFEMNSTDYKSVMNDPDINTVVITTRHNTHARFVIEALRAGKNVFVEKPLCMTTDELDEIRAVIEEKSGEAPLLMVGFNRRFAPLIIKIKKLIGTVAGPKSLIMTVNAGIIPREHWVHDRAVGGGRIVGEVCHFVDLLRDLAGARIKHHNIVTLRNDTNDTVTVSMAFDNGSIGTVHYCSNGNKGFPKERIEVFCGGKILQLDNFRKLTGYGFDGFSKENIRSQDKGHQAEISAFVNAIRNGGPSPIPIEEILEVSEITLNLSAKASDA